MQNHSSSNCAELAGSVDSTGSFVFDDGIEDSLPLVPDGGNKLAEDGDV